MREVLEMERAEQELEYIALEGAEGKIQITETQDVEIVNELTNDVSAGIFHITTSGLVPCKCMDGRKCRNATSGPNAAGGTETIFVGHDLTKSVPGGPEETVENGMRRLVNELQKKGYPVGGHSDEHNIESPETSGCGANDKLPLIYNMIVRKGDIIRQYVEALLGEQVDDATHNLIVGNASSRALFSTGKEVLGVLKATNDARVEQLEGNHNEVVAAVNFRAGTTLSRELLAEKYGNEYQAFNIDAWSFQKAAEETSDSVEEAHQKVIAMTYYNIATALVLCGPAMRIVIVK